MVLRKNAAVVVFVSLYSSTLSLKAYHEDDWEGLLWEDALEIPLVFDGSNMEKFALAAVDVLRDVLVWRFPDDAKALKLLLMLDDAFIYKNRGGNMAEYNPEIKQSIEKGFLRPFLALGESGKVSLLAVTEMLEPQIALEALHNKVLLNYLPKDYPLRCSLHRLDALCYALRFVMGAFCLLATLWTAYLFYDVQEVQMQNVAAEERLAGLNLWKERRQKLEEVDGRIKFYEGLQQEIKERSTDMGDVLLSLGRYFCDGCWLEKAMADGKRLLVWGRAFLESDVHDSVRMLQQAGKYKKITILEIEQRAEVPLSFRLSLELGKEGKEDL